MKILWESKISWRGHISGGIATEDGNLLFEHSDLKGLSLHRFESGEEIWSSRVKKDVLSFDCSETGNSLILCGLDEWWAYSKKDGSRKMIRGVGTDDILIAASDCQGLFLRSDLEDDCDLGGWALADFRSGEVVRLEGNGMFVPAIGRGANFVGSSIIDEKDWYYVGILTGSASCLDEGSLRIISTRDAVEESSVFLVGSGEAGFLLGPRTCVTVSLYDWSGELKSEFSPSECSSSDFDLWRAVTWAGDTGLLLIGRWKSRKVDVLLVVDNIKSPSVSRVIEVAGIYNGDSFGVCGNHLVWLERGMSGGSIRQVDLRDGEQATLWEGTTSSWLVCNETGVYFGDDSKGLGHIMRATI